jgi:hypothetical protein
VSISTNTTDTSLRGLVIHNEPNIEISFSALLETCHVCQLGTTADNLDFWVHIMVKTGCSYVSSSLSTVIIKNDIDRNTIETQNHWK